jgi:hypothetical protein
MSRTKSVPGIALGRWCTLGQTHYRVLGRQFTYPVVLQRFDDISSIPWPRPRQLADEAISICFGIWIGGALDKRDR